MYIINNLSYHYWSHTAHSALISEFHCNQTILTVGSLFCYHMVNRLLFFGCHLKWCFKMYRLDSLCGEKKKTSKHLCCILYHKFIVMWNVDTSVISSYYVLVLRFPVRIFACLMISRASFMFVCLKISFVVFLCISHSVKCLENSSLKWHCICQVEC